MKIAIIGLGVMGRNHFSELLKQDVQILLHDIIRPAWLENNCSFFGDLDELLGQNPDAAIIAAPTAFHYDIFSRIKDKIKNILIEKPLSLNLAQAVKIKEMSRENNVCIGFCERFNPVSLAFKNEIQNDRILYASFIRASRRPDRISDVGVDLDLSVHDIDMANFFGIKSEFFIHRHCEDNRCMQIKLNSARLEILASWRFHSRIRKAIINTSQASFELDFLNSSITKDEKTIQIERKSSLLGEHAAFIELIKNGNIGNLATIDDAIYAQRSLGI